MTLVKMLDRNVQTIVSAETHKALRDAAYSLDVTLKDLIHVVLTEYANSKKNVVKSA